MSRKFKSRCVSVRLSESNVSDDILKLKVLNNGRKVYEATCKINDKKGLTRIAEYLKFKYDIDFKEPLLKSIWE